MKTPPETVAPLDPLTGTYDPYPTSSQLEDVAVLPPADGGSLVAGGFTFRDEIARGGMGIVYRAHDTGMDRDVAIKVLQDDYRTSPVAVRRFLAEGRITGQLQHPGIPPVHQIGTLPDGSPYLAMKLIRGETLTAAIARPDRDPAALVRAFQRVAEAVAYAHSSGVIHRDLKPSNVMVGAFGEVQVMDWGLAKVARHPTPGLEGTGPSSDTMTDAGRDSDTDPDTRTGAVLGTPAFMAPEQAVGAIHLVDERADVFGLGAILCALLTGKPPYIGPSAEATRQMAARADLGAAHARLDGCAADAELVALCRRCLDPDRHRRPADAGAVAAAVAAHLASADERARLAEVDRVRAEGERAAAELRAAAERRRRQALRVWMLTALTVVAVLGAGAWYLQKSVTDKARAEEAQMRLEADVRLDRALQEERGTRIADATLERLPALRARFLWADAESGLDRATQVLGPDGDADRRVRLATARGEVRFLADLDRIRLDRAVASRQPGAAGRFKMTFQANDLDFVTGDEHNLADRLRASPLRPELVSALDDWVRDEPDAAVRDRIDRVITRATGDPVRQRLATAWTNRTALERVALELGPEADAALFARVGIALDLAGGDGPALIERGAKLHPTDFWLRFTLGRMYWSARRNRPVWSVLELRSALAIRPDAAVAHLRLGTALASVEVWDLTGAAAAHRRAIELDPVLVEAHLGLGSALFNLQDATGAAAAYRQAIVLAPERADAHSGLAMALAAQGDGVAAMAAARRALEHDPKNPEVHAELGQMYAQYADFPAAVAAYRRALSLKASGATIHYNLGAALYQMGDTPGAEAAFRTATELSSDEEDAFAGLGLCRLTQGDIDGAVTAARRALRIEPKAASAHALLGMALRARGEFLAAAESFGRAAQLAPDDPDVRRDLERTRRLVAEADRLPAIRAGTVRPAGLDEAIAWADLCTLGPRPRYATAVRYHVEALTADPDRSASVGVAAATTAVRCAAGADESAAPVDVTEWAILQDRAHVWMRAELVARSREAADPTRWPALRATLWKWKRDPDLASIRDAAQLAAMPAVDRDRWMRFWAEADALLDRVIPRPRE